MEVIRRNAPDGEVVARGRLEVRPVKLASPDEYREHYRGMLSQIADKCAGLLLDCRAATRLRLSTLWQENPRILEQQLKNGAIDASAVALASTQLESTRTQDTDIDVQRAQLQHASSLSAAAGSRAASRPR